MIKPGDEVIDEEGDFATVQCVFYSLVSSISVLELQTPDYPTPDENYLVKAETVTKANKSPYKPGDTVQYIGPYFTYGEKFVLEYRTTQTEWQIRQQVAMDEVEFIADSATLPPNPHILNVAKQASPTALRPPSHISPNSNSVLDASTIQLVKVGDTVTQSYITGLSFNFTVSGVWDGRFLGCVDASGRSRPLELNHSLYALIFVSRPTTAVSPPSREVAIAAALKEHYLPKCDCGAKSLGVADYSPGHSDWCAVSESKK